MDHKPCTSRGDCYHARGGRIGGPIGARNQPREAKVRGGRIGGFNQSREAKVRGGRIGARNQAREAKARGGRIGARNQPYEAKVRGGRNQPRETKVHGGRKTNATWGKTPEAREARACGGRNIPREAKVRGGRIGGPIAVESGQLACAAKGVPSTADGILFRSQTEASFYCVMQELGGKPRANPPHIDLPDGRSYFPDFELGRSILDIPANVPIELKPARNAFYQKNLPKAVEAGAFVVYWDELVA